MLLGCLPCGRVFEGERTPVDRGYESGELSGRCRSQYPRPK